jgi:chromosome segregation ATPase
MRAHHWLPLCAAIVPVLAGAPARAEDTPEDRLRAALRQSVTEMRAAQDQASTAQAQLAQAQADLAATKAKLAVDDAKLATYTGKDAEEAKQAEAALQAARAQNGALQQSLAKYQGAIQQAQDIARAKDSESQRAQAGLRSNLTALETCKATNKKLIDVSEQVLHLYQDRSFLWVLRKSYEPLIGAAKVDLQNIVQDYDDKIRNEEYIPPRTLK